MIKVNETMASNMTNYLTNYKAWDPVTYNVAAYGIVGDGIKDNTTAIQNLIYLAISEHRKAIFFQPGIYIINNLVGADKVVFFGDNATVVGSFTGKIYQIGDWASPDDIEKINKILDLKADKTVVNQLAKDKADKVYVDEQFENITLQLSTKAPQSSLDATNTELATKASKAALEDANQQIALRATITYVNGLFSGLGNMSPKGGFPTLSALQAAYPNGAEGIYLVSADSHWYYWNGSSWTDGGVYQAMPWSDFLTTQNQPWEV